MIDFLKANKNKFLIFILFGCCLMFVLSPATYSSSCLNALSVWAINIVPVMFPFFVVTKLILNLSVAKPNRLDKLFNKIYHTPTSTFNVFILSLLAGYPAGAKMVSALYERGQITQADAKRMLSICSISGPMFIIGTVGVSIFLSYTAGVIILSANIIGALINGLIFRSKPSPIKEFTPCENKNTNIVSDTIYDSLISILMVGGFIILSFTFIDMLNHLNIIPNISKTICSILNCQQYQNVLESILSGTIEITRGTIDLSKTNISLQAKTIIASGIIAFSGFSIFLQSSAFLSKLKIPFKTMLLQKTTHATISIIISLVLSFIIF